MSGSFYTAITGLNAFTEQLGVISNNIANSETTAYKSSSISFSEVLSNATSSSDNSSVGSGTAVQAVATSWTQGSISSTGNASDLAITGEGFFVVSDSSGATYYTRDGEFEYNSNKCLVTTDGLYVQGYLINDDGSFGTLTNIDLSSAETIAATATTEITTSLNLNSAADTDTTFSATINTYDSLGNEVPITITFTKSATTNTWTWETSIDSDTGTATGSGTLAFSSEGILESSTTGNPTISLTLTNGATSPQTVNWDLYTSSTSATGTTTYTTNGNVTQDASSSVLSGTTQDGTSSGTLSATSIASDGTITGTYSNGVTKELYQIALAAFSNNDGLAEAGSSLYKATATSGSATYGVAGSGQFGSLTSGSLETSNVDMATQLTEMIVAQRAYEACAKVITTQSEMLQTTMKMA